MSFLSPHHIIIKIIIKPISKKNIYNKLFLKNLSRRTPCVRLACASLDAFAACAQFEIYRRERPLSRAVSLAYALRRTPPVRLSLAAPYLSPRYLFSRVRLMYPDATSLSRSFSRVRLALSLSILVVALSHDNSLARSYA